ncbi:hypothetical protein BC831DRAFT_435443 [Entophlyctis helioformis]|nr:hypothetical protein BC831DRAFT_435443 [Entophlyctis helioformis]
MSLSDGHANHAKGQQGYDLAASPSQESHDPQTPLVQEAPPMPYWALSQRPPSARAVRAWCRAQRLHRQASSESSKTKTKLGPITKDDVASTDREAVSCIEGPTPANTNGYKYTQDPIRSMFYCIQSSDETRFKSNGRRLGYHVGMLVVADGLNPRRSGLGGFEVTTVQTERELLQTLVELVREWDPDMLVGFEIQKAAYQLDLCQGLAAIQDDTARAHHEADQDAWGAKKQSSLHATGRIFLNVWRLLKHELALTSYSLENLAFHVLHKRCSGNVGSQSMDAMLSAKWIIYSCSIPKFSHQSTTAWWEGGLLSRWRTIKYFIERVQDNLELLDATELINRTSEFAKVYGIDIYSVVSRGSQFRVESVMARITRPENYLMFSPSKEQAAHATGFTTDSVIQIRKMRAFECLPLTMEPRTELYTSPMLVLDFQSLYPSMIIAYNMCFSTVLGRVETLGKHEALGAQSLYQIPVGLLERLRDHVNVTPNGVVFVKPHIREGVLGRMLNEILETRVMVKKSMKLYKDNKGLLRVLDAKQLGLKLLANVTYGYTAASYSGRMPCSEIADSIVQSGRVTLERAIRMINATERWGANVVYGDTDSIFVQLQGRTKEEAFAIGNEMVNAATRANPDPIKLKFEKVYLPCGLLAKKRYVGFAFETVEQKEPVFDAKGIETVRRDGCPAVAKMMEQSLKILFRTQDLSQVKDYLTRQWTKILTGHISLEDFIIAKGVKLGAYSAKGPLPPGAHLSSKRMAQDHMAEPQYGERVPYVVRHWMTGTNTQCDHGPKYVDGTDVEQWFHDMPKVYRAEQYADLQPADGNQGQRHHHVALNRGRTIDQFYASRHCIVCNTLCQNTVCDTCTADPTRTLITLSMRASEAQEQASRLQATCRSCTGHQTVGLDSNSACVSLDCPTYFARQTSLTKLAVAQKALGQANSIDRAWAADRLLQHD